MARANPSVPEIGESITFLLVEDLERSTGFYRDDLCLPLVLDQGSCRIFRIVGSAYLGVCERPGRASPEGVIVTLVVDDVEGWHERLSGRGVAVEQAPEENPEYRILHAFYRDPDGYLVEVQRFLEGWPT